MKYLLLLSFFFLLLTPAIFAKPSIADLSNPPSYELTNGYNDNIVLPYTLKEKGSVIIWLHSEDGKAVYCMSVSELEAGHYQEKVSAKHLNKGTYFYSLYVNNKLIDTVKLSI